MKEIRDEKEEQIFVSDGALVVIMDGFNEMDCVVVSSVLRAASIGYTVASLSRNRTVSKTFINTMSKVVTP